MPEIIVKATETQNITIPIVAKILGKGVINKATAIIWLIVFNLPQILAPEILLWLTRQPAIVNSRPKIKNTPQAGTLPNSINLSNF